MKKNILIGFLIFFGLLFTITEAISPEKKEVIQAIKENRLEYFKTVKPNTLSLAFKTKSGTFSGKVGFSMLPFLISGLDNPELEARKIFYLELLFPEKLKDRKSLDEFLQDPEFKSNVNALREKLFSLEEKDIAASELRTKLIRLYNFSLREAINKRNFVSISYFDAQQFKEENSKHEKTIIGRFGKTAIKPLIKAMNEDRMDKETKLQIIEALQFKNTGGISSVIKKDTTRLKRAEDIYLLADKEKDLEVQKKLVELAEVYMPNDLTQP
ncbi:MAG: hypothetical protein SFU98_01030 [Leptospiraceae bacterium]|nr:hypothetical protein [Leptospiraceae bacterium]